VELSNIVLEEQPNSIEGVVGDAENGKVNVYSVDGRIVKSGAERSDALKGLSKGVYIVDGKKYMVK
jgi:alpha-amylase